MGTDPRTNLAAMPTKENITSPITLIGNGRSGTSLVSKAFNRHPNCRFHGETVNLIHSVWHALDSSLPPPLKERMPLAIRRQFMHLFHSQTDFWMHKPIGIPTVSHFMKDEEEFIEWYWHVITSVFPDATYFTVVRHPLDVLVSSFDWWGRAYAGSANSNRLMAKIVMHPSSPITFGVTYEDLIADPETHIRRVITMSGLPWDDECLKPIQSLHSTSRTEIDPAKFHRTDQWADIPPEVVTPEYREAVGSYWEHYAGRPLDWGPFGD